MTDTLTNEKSLSYLVDRTHRDPQFAALVETMVAYMVHNQLSPDQIRDAAYVASIKFMQLRPVRDLVYRNDLDFVLPDE